MTGRIFSIEEFSIYDGPGIRMTIFLKGCPLRCNWCHNPEGLTCERQIVKSENGCLRCGRCLDAGEADTGKRILSFASIAACPRNLIRMSGTDYSPEDITEKVRKNAGVLNASGGGVTFSGGEPLLQADFTAECLKLLAGVTHRAVQTSGYADAAQFEKVLNAADYFLYDLKIINREEHIRYTRCDNANILKNFDTLKNSGKPFVIRVPLIPGVTDTEENLTAIAGLAQGAAGLSAVELLPYNKLAGSKYALVGKKYEPVFDSARPVNISTELFAGRGLKVRVL